MNFQWLNKHGVRSSDGFVLQRIQRFHYHYVINDHLMDIVVLPGREFEELLLNSRSRWKPPYESEVIGIVEFEKTRSNISEALTFMGIKHRIT